MKKLFAIALLLLAVLTASAQEGKWIVGSSEPDELKDEKGGPYYCYKQEGMGSFILWDWKDWAFKIVTDKGKFDVWFNETSNRHYLSFTMGLYTLDGRLVEKFKDVLEADHIDMTSAWMNKKWTHYLYDRSKIKRMFQKLKSGNGYVRIVCKRRGEPDFDIKITPYLDSITY